MQNQADYTFTAIGVQSLRLRLAQNDDGQPPELWAVQIDGQPVEGARVGDPADLEARLRDAYRLAHPRARAT